MSNASFDFKAFVEESKQTLLNPSTYFATMKTDGGFSEPLIKSVIYGAVAGVFAFFWSILHIGAMTGGLFGGSIGIAAFIWSVIGALIALVIGAIILLILSSIAGGNTDFEANARVSAALMVLMPVSAFFGFFSGINHVLGALVSLIINLYGILMIYYALSRTLKGKESTSRILTGILAVLAVVFMITALNTRRMAKRYMKDFESRNEQMVPPLDREAQMADRELT